MGETLYSSSYQPDPRKALDVLAFVLTPVEFDESLRPRIVTVSVETTDKVAFALVARLLIVAFGTVMVMGDEGPTRQSLVLEGTRCGLQLRLSRKFVLDPPTHTKFAIAFSSLISEERLVMQLRLTGLFHITNCRFSRRPSTSILSGTLIP